MAIYDRLYNKYLQQLHQMQSIDNPNNYRKLTPQQFMAYYGNAAKEFKKYLPSLTKEDPMYETALISRVLDNSGYYGYEEKLAKAVGAASPEYRRGFQKAVDNGLDPNRLPLEARELAKTTTSFNEVKRAVTQLSPKEWKKRAEEGYSVKEIIEQSYDVPTKYIKDIQRLLRDAQRNMTPPESISDQYDISGIMNMVSTKLGRTVTIKDLIKDPSLAYEFITTLTISDIKAMSMFEIRSLVALLRNMGYTKEQIKEILSPEEN